MGVLFNAAPTLTEQNLPNQAGKVFIVTGATSGVGRALVEILYAKDAKVYLAARSTEKAKAEIQAIQSKYSTSKGSLHFLKLDLDDLTTIKASAEEFLSKESQLDVLWNNAGVMMPPSGSKTKQGYELQIGTNNVAPQLFTKLLTPVLTKTATSAPKGTVRVVWVASSAAANFAPQGGVDMNNLDYKNDKTTFHKYGVSKAGNILQAREFAQKNAQSGIISVAIDPGNLKTPLYRHIPKLVSPVVNLFLKDPIYGAYTELFAGLHLDVQNGAWIEPWGKVSTPRKDIDEATKSSADGGSGNGSKFCDWMDEQIKPYL